MSGTHITDLLARNVLLVPVPITYLPSSADSHLLPASNSPASSSFSTPLEAVAQSLPALSALTSSLRSIDLPLPSGWDSRFKPFPKFAQDNRPVYLTFSLHSPAVADADSGQFYLQSALFGIIGITQAPPPFSSPPLGQRPTTSTTTTATLGDTAAHPASHISTEARQRSGLYSVDIGATWDFFLEHSKSLLSSFGLPTSSASTASASSLPVPIRLILVANEREHDEDVTSIAATAYASYGVFVISSKDLKGFSSSLQLNLPQKDSSHSTVNESSGRLLSSRPSLPSVSENPLKQAIATLAADMMLDLVNDSRIASVGGESGNAAVKHTLSPLSTSTAPLPPALPEILDTTMTTTATAGGGRGGNVGGTGSSNSNGITAFTTTATAPTAAVPPSPAEIGAGAGSMPSISAATSSAASAVFSVASTFTGGATIHIHNAFVGHRGGGIDVALTQGLSQVSLVMGAAKRRLQGRLLRRRGDAALLAGSPVDALDMYDKAAKAARAGTDELALALIAEGKAAALLLKWIVDNRSGGSNTSSSSTTTTMTKARDMDITSISLSNVPFLPEVASYLREAIVHTDAAYAQPEIKAVFDGMYGLCVSMRVKLAHYLFASPSIPKVLRAILRARGEISIDARVAAASCCWNSVQFDSNGEGSKNEDGFSVFSAIAAADQSVGATAAAVAAAAGTNVAPVGVSSSLDTATSSSSSSLSSSSFSSSEKEKERDSAPLTEIMDLLSVASIGCGLVRPVTHQIRCLLALATVASQAALRRKTEVLLLRAARLLRGMQTSMPADWSSNVIALSAFSTLPPRGHEAGEASMEEMQTPNGPGGGCAYTAMLTLQPFTLPPVHSKMPHTSSSSCLDPKIPLLPSFNMTTAAWPWPWVHSACMSATRSFPLAVRSCAPGEIAACLTLAVGGGASLWKQNDQLFVDQHNRIDKSNFSKQPATSSSAGVITRRNVCRLAASDFYACGDLPASISAVCAGIQEKTRIIPPTETEAVATSTNKKHATSIAVTTQERHKQHSIDSTTAAASLPSSNAVPPPTPLSALILPASSDILRSVFDVLESDDDDDDEENDDDDDDASRRKSAPPSSDDDNIRSLQNANILNMHASSHAAHALVCNDGNEGSSTSLLSALWHRQAALSAATLYEETGAVSVLLTTLLTGFRLTSKVTWSRVQSCIIVFDALRQCSEEAGEHIAALSPLSSSLPFSNENNKSDSMRKYSSSGCAVVAFSPSCCRQGNSSPAKNSLPDFDPRALLPQSVVSNSHRHIPHGDTVQSTTRMCLLHSHHLDNTQTRGRMEPPSSSLSSLSSSALLHHDSGTSLTAVAAAAAAATATATSSFSPFSKQINSSSQRNNSFIAHQLRAGKHWASGRMDDMMYTRYKNSKNKNTNKKKKNSTKTNISPHHNSNNNSSESHQENTSKHNAISTDNIITTTDGPDFDDVAVVQMSFSDFAGEAATTATTTTTATEVSNLMIMIQQQTSNASRGGALPSPHNTGIPKGNPGNILWNAKDLVEALCGYLLSSSGLKEYEEVDYEGEEEVEVVENKAFDDDDDDDEREGKEGTTTKNTLPTTTVAQSPQAAPVHTAPPMRLYTAILPIVYGSSWVDVQW